MLASCQSRQWSPFICVLLVCLGMFDYYGPYIVHPPIPIGIGLTAFFILMLRAPTLRVPFLVRMGKISYSIYLLHFPIILWCFQKWGHFGSVHLFATSVLILLLSHLLYTGVERPSMAFARRFRKQQPVTAP